LIYKGIENKLEPDYLWPKLDKLRHFLINYDRNNALQILSDLVKEWEMTKKYKKG